MITQLFFALLVPIIIIGFFIAYLMFARKIVVPHFLRTYTQEIEDKGFENFSTQLNLVKSMSFSFITYALGVLLLSFSYYLFPQGTNYIPLTLAFLTLLFVCKLFCAFNITAFGNLFFDTLVGVSFVSFIISLFSQGPDLLTKSFLVLDPEAFEFMILAAAIISFIGELFIIATLSILHFNRKSRFYNFLGGPGSLEKETERKIRKMINDEETAERIRRIVSEQLEKKPDEAKNKS
jgi:hypothetical protein